MLHEPYFTTNKYLILSDIQDEEDQSFQLSTTHLQPQINQN